MSSNGQVITRYSTVAIVLHWAIALLLVSNIALYWISDSLPEEQGRALMDWHKSTGMLILILSLFRLGWRWFHPVPPYPAGLPQLQKFLAKAVHVGFYVIMIGMPLTGWVMMSGAPPYAQIIFYGLFEWPRLPFVDGAQGAAADFWDAVGGAHEVLAWFAYGLIALHVAGALYHQFIARDAIMARMSPRLGK